MQSFLNRLTPLTIFKLIYENIWNYFYWRNDNPNWKIFSLNSIYNCSAVIWSEPKKYHHHHHHHQSVLIELMLLNLSFWPFVFISHYSWKVLMTISNINTEQINGKFWWSVKSAESMCSSSSGFVAYESFHFPTCIIRPIWWFLALSYLLLVLFVLHLGFVALFFLQHAALVALLLWFVA